MIVGVLEGDLRPGTIGYHFLELRRVFGCRWKTDFHVDALVFTADLRELDDHSITVEGASGRTLRRVQLLVV